MKDLKLNPRAVNSGDFPVGGTPKEQLKFLLNYAVLAPSLHNAQPWLFKLSNQDVEIIFNQNLALPIVDPKNREMIISCGAALGNLEVAARYYGYRTNIQLASSEGTSDYLAKVSLSKGAPPSANDIAMFKAIALRQTSRHPFSSEKASTDILEKCVNTASACAVEFSSSSDEKAKSEIAKLTAVADKEQFSRPWFRVELASWMHSNKRDSKDGMSAHRFGLPDFFTPITGFIIRTFNIGKRVANSNIKKIQLGSPILGIFATQTDHQNDWLNTGRALAQVLLVFNSVGFSVSYLNQSIEIGVFRNLLRREFTTLAYPQIMLRIGRAKTGVFSVRRSVEDCLIA